MLFNRQFHAAFGDVEELSGLNSSFMGIFPKNSDLLLNALRSFPDNLIRDNF